VFEAESAFHSIRSKNLTDVLITPFLQFYSTNKAYSSL